LSILIYIDLGGVGLISYKMSNPKRYLSDAARLRDERRRSLLDELEKLKKEDDEEEKQRERERSRIKELNQDRERSIKRGKK
jgi:hypothetical protein